MWERDQIPGFAEAQDSERVDRAIAFVGLPELIAGVTCAALTPIRVEWMRCYSNPYFVGGDVTLYSRLQFLWFVSPSFQSGKQHMQEFLRQHEDLDAEALANDIEAYLDRAYLDSPHGDGRTPYYEPVASLIVAMGEEPFRWRYEQTISTPLAILFQLLKCRDRSRGDTVINRRSYKAENDWLVILNAKLKEEANGQ